MEKEHINWVNRTELVAPCKQAAEKSDSNNEDDSNSDNEDDSDSIMERHGFSSSVSWIQESKTSIRTLVTHTLHTHAQTHTHTHTQ